MNEKLELVVLGVASVETKEPNGGFIIDVLGFEDWGF